MFIDYADHLFVHPRRTTDVDLLELTLLNLIRDYLTESLACQFDILVENAFSLSFPHFPQSQLEKVRVFHKFIQLLSDQRMNVFNIAHRNI